MWVNGSFATRNPNPNDVDIVVWIPSIVLSTLSDEQLEEISYLTGEEGRPVTREKYACDVYAANPSDFNAKQYWRERFSSNPDSENQKGIAVITI